MEDIIETGPSGLKFISGGNGLIDILNIEKNSKYQLIRALDTIQKNTDFLLVDIPAGASDNSMTFASAVDKLIIVLVSEPTSFMDAYTFIKTARLDHNINHFSIVVNMTENGKEAENTFFKFRDIVTKFLDVNLTFLGGVPRSKKVQNAIIRKLPIVLQKNAELERLAFQRISKKIFKAGENNNNGIRFFSKSINIIGIQMKASYPEQQPNVESLIVDNMNLVKKISLAYAWQVRSAMEIEDLMQIGYYGLVQPPKNIVLKKVPLLQVMPFLEFGSNSRSSREKFKSLSDNYSNATKTKEGGRVFAGVTAERTATI